MPYKLITAPTTEPVTLDEAKAHLVISSTDHDEIVGFYVKAAREWVEKVSGRAHLTQTWDLFLDKFPSTIYIGKSPTASVTSVKYLDTNGVQQTLVVNTDYIVDINSEPARITPAVNKSWPSTYSQINAVEVRFVAGWNDISLVPETSKLGIRMLIGHLFENRGDVTEAKVREILAQTASIFATDVVHGETSA